MAHITELEAVNLMRGALGKAPVASLNTTNPDIAAARLRLKNSSTELQTKRWWFNTELSFKLAPNTSDEIVIPQNALEVRPKDPFTYLTIRGNRLYDPCENTFKFDTAVTVEMLLNLDYADLPYAAANFIQYDAARKYVSDYDGDPKKIAELRGDSDRAMLILKESEQRNNRVNVLLSSGPQRMIRRQGITNNPLYPGG